VAWLLREKIEGTTLHDMIIKGQFYNERAVLLGVLEQLVVLEKSHLYHSDIRSWNIVIDRNGHPTLIDFNEISQTKRDAVWSDSIYLAFFIFINEVVTHRHLMTEISRCPFISPFSLPEPYRHWGMQIWHRPLSEWSFALMLETLKDLPQSLITPVTKNEKADGLWIQSMEENVELLHRTIEEIGRYLRRVHTLVVADHQVLEDVLHKKDQ
jgi:O-antigen chain-terminating methyltransferase